jgi:RTX calcium-binding nonapeptide repeat (4 copies)
MIAVMLPRACALLLVVLASALAAAAGAQAQSRTLGSPLNLTPNTFGCEIRPTVTEAFASGNYLFLPSGLPDCTWFQSGVPGAVDYSDPRTGSVPANGRITAISVSSGNNPAPLSFVILRQLAQPGTGSACCFLVGESQLVQPAPNQISTFTVNLPVERNVNPTTRIATADYVGFSAQSGTGTLPLASNGLHNVISHASIAGNPHAGFYYPRLGAFPNDSGGGRHEEGIPGMEVLLRWTWCPAGQACGPPVVPNAGNSGGDGSDGGGDGSDGDGSGGPGSATAGPDTITGTDGPDRLCGLGGDDSIDGLRGDDTLFGDGCAGAVGATAAAAGGDDMLRGGPGGDDLRGGGGKDRLKGGGGTNRYAGGGGKDVLKARNGKAETVNCGGGRDRAVVDSSDTVRGCEKVIRPNA